MLCRKIRLYIRSVRMQQTWKRVCENFLTILNDFYASRTHHTHMYTQRYVEDRFASRFIKRADISLWMVTWDLGSRTKINGALRGIYIALQRDVHTRRKLVTAKESKVASLRESRIVYDARRNTFMAIPLSRALVAAREEERKKKKEESRRRERVRKREKDLSTNLVRAAFLHTRCVRGVRRAES